MRSIEAQAATTEKAVQKALDALGLRRDQVTVEVLREAEAGTFLGIGRKDAIVRVTEVEHEGMPQAEAIAAAPGSEAEVDAYSAPRFTEEIAADSFYEEEELAVQEALPVADDADDADDARAEDSDEWSDESSEMSGDDARSLNEDMVQAWNDLLATEGKKPAAVLARAFIEAVLQLMHLEGDLTVTVHEDKAEGTLLVDVDGDDCGILIGRRGATLSALQYMLILLLHRHAQESYFVQLDIGGYHRRRREGLEDLARQTAKRALETGNAYELNPMKAQDRRVIHETLANMEGIITYSEGQGRNRFVVIDLEDYDN